jgi:hypothetical protein
MLRRQPPQFGVNQAEKLIGIRAWHPIHGSRDFWPIGASGAGLC